jgi:hypothetical protein
MIWGEFAGLAPVGTESQTTSWGAELSESVKVTVVPGATVRLAGEKLSVVSVPTFWGIFTPAEPPAGVLVVDLLVVVVLVAVGVLLLVLVVVLVVVVLMVVLVVVDFDVVLVVEADVEEEAELELDADVLVEGSVAVLVELAVIVGLPAPLVVHHMVVHVDDAAEEVAVAVVVAAELDADVVVALAL